MRSRTVLISGASIAGPALAYWLNRYGFTTTIVETAPSIRPGGQAVDLRGVGKEVAERMGIMPAVRARTVDELGLSFVDRDSRPGAQMPADMFGGEGIISEIEIMRGDLTDVLVEATAADTEYLFDDRIAALTQDANGVTVDFDSGTRRVFDFVVGADGVHSGVRRLAFGPETDFVRPLGAYTAYFTVPDPGDLDGWVQMHNAPGQLVALIRPERDGKAKAMLSFASKPLRYDRRDIRQQQQILATAFAGVGWRLPTMIEAMWNAPDFYFDSVDQVVVDKWSRGRITLVGDAASCGSPLTGLGTSMALVEAYVLAGELASTPEDHESAFTRYQETLHDYVTKGRELPPGGVNGYAPKSQFMISMRNVSMRMMTRWPVRNMLAKQFQKADALTLPEYRAQTEPAV